MSANPKPERERDRAFLEFVHEQSCAVCYTEPVDAHHLKTKASGGSDLTCVPLCRAHHDFWHRLGDKKFTIAHGVNLWRVNADLLRRYIGERLRRDPAR
jgi:hypothetical protein